MDETYEKLKAFFAELATDAHKLAEFRKDPEACMTSAGLSHAEKEICRIARAAYPCTTVTHPVHPAPPVTIGAPPCAPGAPCTTSGTMTMPVKFSETGTLTIHIHIHLHDKS